MLGSPAIRARLDHPRFAGPTLRVLLLDARYHLVGELVRALGQLGHAVAKVPVVEDAEAMVRGLLTGLVEHRPDFVLTVNHLGFDAGGVLGEILETLEIPVAAWYVDSPIFVLRGGPIPAPSMTTLFTWERALVPVYRPRVHTEWLPLGADPELFSGAPNAEPDGAPAFVGNSGAAAQAKWRARLGPEHEPAIAAREAAVARRGPAPFADPALLDDPVATDHLAAATWRANSRLRANFLSAFLPELALYGDEGWPEVLPGARPLPGPGYGRPLAEVYRRHPVQLNVTSLQMPTAVNQRVFDAPLAGGFVLGDAQDDLHELFTEDEFVTWSSPEEAVDKARFYLERPERRVEILGRARARILNEHTYQHRARTLVAALRRRHRPAAAAS